PPFLGVGWWAASAWTRAPAACDPKRSLALAFLASWPSWRFDPKPANAEEQRTRRTQKIGSADSRLRIEMRARSAPTRARAASDPERSLTLAFLASWPSWRFDRERACRCPLRGSRRRSEEHTSELQSRENL